MYDDANKNGILAEDIKEFDGDDPYDGCRYLVKAVDRFVSIAAREFDRNSRISRVVEQLKKTNDWTSYYINMDKLEAREKRNNSPQFLRRGPGNVVIVR